MHQLSLSQQYLLCALKKNGALPSFGMEKSVCLTAACVLELLLENVLAFDGKRLTVRGPLPEESAYLRPVWQVVEQKQPVKFETVVEYFSLSLTDARLKELLTGLGDSLLAAGRVRREKGGLLGGRELYPPQAEAVDAVVQGIRAELLEEGPLSQDTVALTALLYKSGDLKKYFSSYEKDALKRRLKEIREQPQSEMVRKAIEYVDSLLVLVIVAAT